MYVLAWLTIGSLFLRQNGASTLPPPYTGKCLVGEAPVYPPGKQFHVPTYVVQLDLPPAKRWTQIAGKYSKQLKELTQAIRNVTDVLMKDKIMEFVDKFLVQWINKFSPPYAEELEGIANATGIPLGEIVLYNVIYELSAACTSVVAQDQKGEVYAARNLDFGFLLGWDARDHQWILTKLLRKLVVNLEWRFQEKIIFKSSGFVGFIGVLTGVKPNVFTLSINERFDWDGGVDGILKWLLNLEKSKWVTWMSREVMTKAGTYEEAVFSLSIVRLMAPVYFIVSGCEQGNGVVITRSRERTLDLRSLNSNGSSNWYLLQTNYDPWANPLALDDRRTPGKLCMDKLGRSNVSFPGLYSVLSSKPVLNKLTVYTSLMFAKNGTIETYIQNCQGPCWFV